MSLDLICEYFKPTIDGVAKIVIYSKEMRELSNNLLKKSGLTTCLCAPGVVAEALEHLMRGEAGHAEFDACVRYDPVLALRLYRLSGDYSPQKPTTWRRVRSPCR